MLLPFPRMSQWGYINETGAFCIMPQYVFAGTFIDGLAVVACDKLKGVVNARNEVIVPFEYLDIVDYLDGFTLGKRDGNQFWEVIDMNGRTLSSCEWGWNLGQGLFAMLREGNSGFVVTDATGTAVNDVIYQEVLGLVESVPMLLCKRNGCFCLENLYGDNNDHRLIKKFDFDYMYEFYNGKAIAYKEGRAGIVDIEGNTVVPFLFDEVQRLDYSFERFVLVKTAGADRFRFFEVSTGVLFDLTVENAFCVSCRGEQFYWVFQNGKWSILDADFRTYVCNVGDSAEQMSDSAVLVGTLDGMKYYVVKEGRISEMLITESLC